MPAEAQRRPAGPPDTRVAIGEGEIVVTAGPEARAGPLTSIDRLGGETAQRAMVGEGWQLFARLPGVVLTEFGQGTTSGRFSIRGFNGEGSINAVRLTIDGIPSNDNAGAMPFIDLVAPIDVGTVELVRGTADPRTGLHAIAGSADVRTRQGGTFLDARAVAGAFGTREIGVSAGVETGRLSQTWLLNRRRSDGYRAHAAGERLTIAGKWSLDLGEGRIALIARRGDSEAEEPGYLTEADIGTDARRRQSYPLSATDGGTRALGQYGLRLDAQIAPRLSLSALGYANSLDDDRYVRFSAAVAQQRRLAAERQVGGTAALHWRGATWLAVEVGGDVQRQRNRSRRWTTDRRPIVAATRDQRFGLTVGGVYAQAVVTPVRWLTVTPGWRLERVGGAFEDGLTGRSARVNRYGTISQPKLAVAVTPAAGVTLYGNAGRTFQIGAGSGAFVVPPRVRDLRPSINTGYEAGLRLVRGPATAQGAVWRQTATGELARRLGDPAGEFDNLGATRRQGFDLELSVAAGHGVSAWANWSRQSAVIRVPDPATPALAGKTVDHVPRDLGSAGIAWAPAGGRWRGSLWGNGQSAYAVDTSNTHGRGGGYVRLTAEAGLRLSRRLELSVEVRNLGDARADYVWFDGTQRLYAPGEPRAVFAAVRARL